MRTNTKVFFILLLLGSSFFTAEACVNETHTTLKGTIIEEAIPASGIQARHIDRQQLTKQLLLLDSLYKATDSIDYLSDYAVGLIYNGEYEKAKVILHDIERRMPGRYSTAANLGTAYELLGDNNKALFWIQKAVAINPESHKYSEWIHVKILEAKVAKRPPEGVSLLGLDFGSLFRPESALPDSMLRKISQEIQYQLTERMLFVKPPDPYVASLLFDLGNITAVVVDVEGALALFAQAKEYGFKSAMFDLREKKFTELTVNTNNRKIPIIEHQQSPILVVVISIATLLLLIGIWVIWWKVRR